jgi:hypothetical protein
MLTDQLRHLASTEERREVLRCAREFSNVLNLLQDRLSRTIKTWKRFSSGDGDINYFLTTSSHLMRSTLEDIQQKFDALENFEQQLRYSKEVCAEAVDAVSESHFSTGQ